MAAEGVRGFPPGVVFIPEEALKQIEEAIRTTKSGSVTLVVQDSRVIQMNKQEKIRFV